MARQTYAKRSKSRSDNVDVHCHIFNGRDLPVREFVRQVLLVDYSWLGDLLDPAVAFCAYIMDSDTPSACDEMNKLNQMQSDRITPAAFLSQRRRNRQTRETAIVTDALERLHYGDITSTPAGRNLSPEVPLVIRRAFVQELRRQASSREPAFHGSIDLGMLTEKLLPGGIGFTGTDTMVPYVYALSFRNSRRSRALLCSGGPRNWVLRSCNDRLCLLAGRI